ncbi:MAG: DNA polymerase III subunit beta [Solirubrobacterales bacterium]|nr:DNA polymerase III subunit beta [Solirubrobacterales bacterium]MCB8971677.1 DNA polymerase III subunit beta [Thermoleophilales bacterium]MCO5326670.1 DNA polymerase III subunit beta [Solirubrobacterales bacterium]
MQLKAERDPLLDGLQTAARALSTRTTLPSLGGIMLIAAGGKLTARATDSELAVSVEVDAEVEGEGQLLLPGRLLADVARALPQGPVTISERSAEHDVEIKAGTAQFHLRLLDAEDFPRLPELEGETITMPAPALAETVERVARAASRDEVRPILTGIMVSVEGNSLTMVATDSYRLSVKRTELADAVAEPFEANVPARAMRELARVVSQGGVEEVQVAMPGNQIVFGAGGVTLSSRLIDGQFPNYRQLLPDAFDHDVKLPRGELLDVTRRIRYLAQRNAPLKMAFAEGELTVAAETPEIGDASESMPCAFSGEAMEIAFNPQFFIEGVESVETEEVVLRLTSPLRPGLLQPAGSEDFSYLVMPIRLTV